MYSHGDSHLEPATGERGRHAPENAMPGFASRQAPLALTDGGSQAMSGCATAHGVGAGSAPEADVLEPQPWFLAYTRPGQEQQAQQNLGHQAYESYFPQYKRIKKTAGGAMVMVEPLFPRYVFFRPLRAGQSITPVRSTRGISHIVRFGELPAVVQPDVLGAIRQLERERDMVDEAAGDSLQPGQKVRLLDSAFEGLEGLVKSASRRRVAVLLEFLGRQQVVHAPPEKVTSV